MPWQEPPPCHFELLLICPSPIRHARRRQHPSTQPAPIPEPSITDFPLPSLLLPKAALSPYTLASLLPSAWLLDLGLVQNTVNDTPALHVRRLIKRTWR